MTGDHGAQVLWHLGSRGVRSWGPAEGDVIMEITREGLVAAIAGVATVGAILIVVNAGHRDQAPNPVPSSGLRTATQGPRTTYPDCRDTAERPCVHWAEDGSVLVTETGARIPAIVVTRHPGNPRTIEIR